MSNGRLTWMRRWKTAEAAMRAVDREYPLPSHKKALKPSHGQAQTPKDQET
jgi:hypothetical protein